jgi:BirA family biotin operon repressor/biotin-[acetyl-CoA-carboxylase] ligase
VLEHFTDGITVKWPNDIYWKDFKMAGTLIEPSLRQGRVGDCIIGTGINVNQSVFLSDAPNPVSLRQACGHQLDRGEVASLVTERLLYYISQLEFPDNWPSIREAYRHALYRKEGIYWYQASTGEFFKAALHTVEDDGFLVLEVLSDDGKTDLRKFAFKEIIFHIQ